MTLCGLTLCGCLIVCRALGVCGAAAEQVGQREPHRSHGGHTSHGRSQVHILKNKNNYPINEDTVITPNVAYP
jgi:hypothetical protein